jgi:hypothetical protein
MGFPMFSIPTISAPIPIAVRANPRQSRRAASGVRAFGTSRRARGRAARPIGTLMTKIHRHDA